MWKLILGFGPIMLVWVLIWGVISFVFGNLSLFVVACFVPIILLTSVAVLFLAVLWLGYIGVISDDDEGW